MTAPERYEQLIAFLESQLPTPVERQGQDDGALRFLSGDPCEVVVLLTETTVVVSSFAGRWESSFKFVATPRRVGLLKWRRLPETALWGALAALIKGAREARRSSFQICSYCGQNTAPEWLRGDGVCEPCAAQHLGIVH